MKQAGRRCFECGGKSGMKQMLCSLNKEAAPVCQRALESGKLQTQSAQSIQVTQKVRQLSKPSFRKRKGGSCGNFPVIICISLDFTVCFLNCSHNCKQHFSFQVSRALRQSSKARLLWDGYPAPMQLSGNGTKETRSNIYSHRNVFFKAQAERWTVKRLH